MAKRDRRSRIRGRRTCGWGSRKKHRGSGQRGGVGMAGTGKKAGQKIPFLKKYFPKGYLGKKGFKSIGQRFSTKPMAINLEDIDKRAEEFEKRGMLKKTAEGKELNLEGFKVLGDGELKEKLIINAACFSKTAREKIESIGGKAVEKEKK